MNKQLLLCLLSVVLNGCGTIMMGTTQKVHLSSNPPGALANVDSYHVNTPAVVELSRAKNHTVVFQKAGYQEDTETLTSAIEWNRAGNAMATDFLGFSGPIGAMVDWHDGAMSKLSKDDLDVTLVALPAPIAGNAAAPPTPPQPPVTTETLPAAEDAHTAASAGPLARGASVFLEGLMVIFSGVLL